jgi:transposase
LAGIAISPGSIYNAVQMAAARAKIPVAAIGEALVGEPLAHADETGVRVGGALQWLLVLSNARLTAYFPHPKHGGEAIAAGGVLNRFASVLVHDHWKPYASLTCQHANCNAHHLRELTAIAETIPS